jgi:hypothetical protein
MQAVGNRLEGLPRGPAPLVQWTVLLFATLLALLIISVPLDFGAQCVFAIGCFVAALEGAQAVGTIPGAGAHYAVADRLDAPHVLAHQFHAGLEAGWTSSLVTACWRPSCIRCWC